VALTADRDYQAGERILAWCGPQPNSRVRSSRAGNGVPLTLYHRVTSVCIRS
jgi:hypothetical protein